MVLGRGFKSRLHLKTRWKKIDHLMAKKLTKNNKDSTMGQVTPKKYLKNSHYNIFLSCESNIIKIFFSSPTFENFF